jgi:hypothetical protein
MRRRFVKPFFMEVVIMACMHIWLLSNAKNIAMKFPFLQKGNVIPHLVEGGVSILQYADDMILFMEHDIDKVVNMKLILCLFEQLSSLKINFHKSELFCFGKAKDSQHDYKEIFGCAVGALPFKYLGIPIHFRKLLIKEWKVIKDRFEKKLASWISKILSYGDRLILINSVLTSLPMFLLSFFQIPIGVRKRLDIAPASFGIKRNIDYQNGI